MPLQRFASAQVVPSATGTFWQPSTIVAAIRRADVAVVAAHGRVLAAENRVAAVRRTLVAVVAADRCVLQPSSASQLSVVQAFPSLQSRSVPGEQIPGLAGLGPVAEVAVHAGSAIGHRRVLAAEDRVTAVRGADVGVVAVEGGPGAQAPVWQVSVPLQRSPSRQEVPFATGVLWQPWTASQLSVVQTLQSSQSRVVPAVQTPAWQVSVPLQRSPSRQVVPSATGDVLATENRIAAVGGADVAVVAVEGRPGGAGARLAGLVAVAEVGVADRRCHSPPACSGSRRPGRSCRRCRRWRRRSRAACRRVQVPAWQVSSPLQRSPSAQEVPSAPATFWQPRTGSQLSVVQTLPSSQLIGAFWQPSTASQLSAVQASESSQLIGHVLAAENRVAAVGGTRVAVVTVHRRVLAAGARVAAVGRARVPVVAADRHVLAAEHRIAAVRGTGLAVVAVRPARTGSRATASQLSDVQASASSQLTGAYWQPRSASQLSAVQASASSQSSGVPGAHPGRRRRPPWCRRCRRYSSSRSATGVFTQPVEGLQLSVVQTLESLQLGGGPPMQIPP